MPTPILAIHGGAGAIARAQLTARREREIRQALAAALEAGWTVLVQAGSSLDAVEQAVRALEDSPHFNAGRGAVFNAAGEIELDACIMDGRTLRAGAVGAVRSIRNPVSAARAVMAHSRHVLLAGKGAEDFARTHGLELVPSSYFHTDARWQAWQRARAGIVLNERDRHGTVGAVALDAAGNLAAATSTGGLTNKSPGRIGDSPVVGAGTYADGRVAVSGTGDGDVFLCCTAAYRVAALIELAGATPGEAARGALAEIERHGGRGGMIVLDREGTLAMPFTTEGMYRGVRRGNRPARTAIYRDALR